MLTLKLEDIQENGNVRIDVGDVESLAASIAQVGLLQPITVKPTDSADESAGYTLVTGARRLAALKSLGLAETKAIVDKLPMETADVLAVQWAENFQRENLTAWEAAQVAMDLKVTGLKQNEVAVKMGIPKTEVSDLQKVARGLSDDNVKDSSATQLSATALLELVEKTTPERAGDALELIVTGEAKSVSSAVAAVAREYELIEFYDEISEKQRMWHESNVVITTERAPDQVKDDSSYSGYRSDPNIVDIRKLGIPEDKHIGLTCHTVYISSGETSPYSGQVKPSVTHWCIAAKSHTPTKTRTPTVVSPVAVKDTERKTMESKDRRANKDAKQVRIEQAAYWMGETNTAAQREAMTNDRALSTWRSDDTKAALVMLDLLKDRPVGAEYTWYDQTFEAWCEKTFGDNHLKRDRWMVKFLLAHLFIADQYGRRNSVVSDELAAIELPAPADA